MLSCKEVTQLVSQGQDRPLALPDRCALALHLMLCEGCRNFRRQVEFLRAAFRRLAGGAAPLDETPRPRE